MAGVDIRKGMPSVTLTKDEFAQRFRDRFRDPTFANIGDSLQAVIDAAWDGYHQSRKSPETRKAGPGFADPDYDIAFDWLAARGGGYAEALADRARIRAAIGDRFADPSAEIAGAAEIALFPPVTGG